MEDTISQIHLQVTQWWRGKDAQGNIQPLSWALTYKISGSDHRPMGTKYGVAGTIDTYAYEVDRSVPIRHEGWRGSLVVGRIAPDALEQLERILSQIPVVRGDPSWNCHNWVWHGIRELRQAGFIIDPNLTWQGLRDKMLELLEAWERGDI
ncbi:uncharacterized protein BXZ73DRAFT_87358 [Epithele typhae]|uniref:uncharacterized protein n=1 Tax=Epithele typhae TaxID=378194 RepID=UPI002008B149|nr:uncharacterized protein BXZ73DRAFT_87358 [Epithele typhae]KAH9944467.1 hypothetical protein BXZ73DRAFT_87358 [Epithele typhae]